MYLWSIILSTIFIIPTYCLWVTISIYCEVFDNKVTKYLQQLDCFCLMADDCPIFLVILLPLAILAITGIVVFPLVIIITGLYLIVKIILNKINEKLEESDVVSETTE